MLKIEGFRGQFALSTAALVSLSSVIMTYFGVNYYLSGLHSYASGDSVPIPSFVYVSVIILLAICLYAYTRFNKLVKVSEMLKSK